jgi:SAM-dependent methyltransferase
VDKIDSRFVDLPQSRIPSPIDRLVARTRTVYRAVRDDKFVGKYDLECPMCGYSGLFKWFGDPPRRDARCKSCGSLERHRLLKLWFDRNESRLRGGTALHFAPEQSVVKTFKPAASRYITTDIVPGKADIVRNIEDMPEEKSGTYDWIVCSHVLEHVNDQKALAELHRIIKPGGILIIMIPIVEGWAITFEDADIQSDSDRAKYFGQADHVRYYGSDARQRFTAAGFTLEEFTATEPDVSRYGLTRGEKVFVALRS